MAEGSSPQEQPLISIGGPTTESPSPGNMTEQPAASIMPTPVREPFFKKLFRGLMPKPKTEQTSAPPPPQQPETLGPNTTIDGSLIQPGDPSSPDVPRPVVSQLGQTTPEAMGASAINQSPSSPDATEDKKAA